MTHFQKFREKIVSTGKYRQNLKATRKNTIFTDHFNCDIIDLSRADGWIGYRKIKVFEKIIFF
jgi:hypothetical protein